MNEMMMGSASAVVYADSGSIKAELFVLNLLSPQTVHRNFLDESGWNWADQGIGGTTATNKITNHLTTPMVLTFKDGAQARKIYVFTTGFVPPDREFADTGNLYANEWDGNMWNWVNHGNPGVPLTGEPVGRGTPVSGGPSQGAITYADGAIRQIHVFVRGNDGVVYMLHGNVNDQWQWAPASTVGAPPGTIAVGSVTAVTYRDGGAQQKRIIDVFVLGKDGNLFQWRWNGVTSDWLILGRPTDTMIDIAGPAVVTYRDPPDARILEVFVKGLNGHLYRKIEGLQWEDLGTPPATILKQTSLSAITYREGSNQGPRRTSVFVTGYDRRLYRRILDGQGGWESLGPTDEMVVGNGPAAVVAEGLQGPEVYLFVKAVHAVAAGSDKVYLKHWNGSQWTPWQDHGGL